MLPLSETEDFTEVTRDVSEAERSVTLKSSSGPTDKKGLGHLVGWLMSNAEGWLMEEKSFEITGASILFSAVVISVLLGVSLGIRFDRSKFDRIQMSGKNYQMVGVGQIDDKGQQVYVPVYKEIN